MGFKNAKKGSNVAAQTAAMDVAQVINKMRRKTQQSEQAQNLIRKSQKQRQN